MIVSTNLTTKQMRHVDQIQRHYCMVESSYAVYFGPLSTKEGIKSNIVQ